MKILVTGAEGMLAKEIKKLKIAGYEIFAYNKNELDITQKNQIEEKLQKHQYKYIINCAAYTAVDLAEDNKKQANMINGEAVKNIAECCKKYNCILIHFSTDYIFDGEKNIEEEYTEKDNPNPINAYGHSKLLGEEYIKTLLKDYYILRTSWLYGDGPNFIKKIIELSEKNSELNVIDDQVGSPTYTVDLAQIVKQMIEKQIPFGVYNTTNLGYMSWCELAKTVFNKKKINCKVNNIKTAEYKTKAKRPLNSKLSKNKILQEGIEIPTFENALTRYLEVLKEN